MDEASAESLARKTRSEARLREEGVPINEHLPAIEDEREARIRSVDEIVDRVIALFAVAGVAEGAPRELVDRYMREFHAESKLTPEERSFVAAPTDRRRVQLSWRYEAVYPLLWALGFFSDLPRPERQVDPSQLGNQILSRSETAFRAAARRRSEAEILDEADLIYRYAWAVRDASLSGKPPPAQLEGGVIRERHHALNCLVGYGGDDWDDVSTDT